ncbi:TonB-dependent receptor [Filimonas lacunae]|nr:TonB-dependent receptor [Filimonas lacunae]
MLAASYANAQTNPAGTAITGNVMDKDQQQAIAAATVTLYKNNNKTSIASITTKANGAFTLPVAGSGLYKVSVTYIGYASLIMDSIVVKAGQQVALGNILLVKQISDLQGVTIVASRPLVENKIDKVVFNAEKDVTSQGGSAIDILRKVPQVNVDINGNVELQGNANIRFLINGKPSSSFGNSLADALASIPASQIKSIEAITSPGAKYDAQGTGGIINIILKDNRLRGINGTVNGSAGTRFESGSVNLNYRQGNWGLSGFFNANAQLSSRTPSYQDRTSYDTISKNYTRLVQDGSSDFTRHSYQTGLSFDWSPGKKDNITASFGYSYFGNALGGITAQQQMTTDASANLLSTVNTTRYSNSRSHNNSFDWSAGYQKKLRKEGQELNVLYSASFGTPQNSYLLSQNYTGQPTPYTGSFSNNPGTDHEHNLSIDYTHPLSDKVSLETGVKTVWQHINSSSAINNLAANGHDYAYDPSQSYQLGYDMKVYAGYVSASFPLFNYLDVKAGARFEHTALQIDFPNTTIPSYNTLVPSIAFIRHISDKKFVKLTYSRRLERPEYKELNPFINRSDPYNFTTGNPLLKPEIGNNFELGYGLTFPKGGNIYLAVVERINTNDLKPYTLFYPTYTVGDSVYTNVSVTNRQNIGKEYNTGLMLSGSVPVTRQFNLRGNVMVFQRRVVNNLPNGNIANGTNYRFNLNGSYTLPKDLIVEAFGNYNSSINTIQGKRPQSLTYTLALRKQFWNKNASIGLTATNPFSRYVSQVITINSLNYLAYNTTWIPYRSFGISFLYKFGKLEFKKSKDDNNNFIQNMPGT